MYLKKRIAIFASGSGSNAQKIMEHFKKHNDAEVAIVLSNNTDVTLLKSLEVDLIVLAGFLWLIPENLLRAFPNKIINIHPALLPKYGGKGMYGDKVHKSILENAEEESGITIHFVNECFDEGEIIHQSRFRIEKGDDLEMIKFKGQQLEHLHYPKIIEQLIKRMKSV